MSELILSRIATGYNLSLINNNFTKIKGKIDSDVLQNKNGNNTMYQSLDMNGYSIVNTVTDPTNPTSLVTYSYLSGTVTNVNQAVINANQAAITANTASALATQAANVSLAVDAKATLALNTANSKQNSNANLTSLSNLTLAADTLPYGTASGTLALTSLTSFGRSLIDDTSSSVARTTLGLGNAATLNVGTTTLTVAAGDDARLNTIDGTYISGLQLQWVSSTAITVTGGSAWIPSLSRVLQVGGAIAKSGLTIAASTMYHAYLFFNGTVADVEFVTTVPSAPYLGTARTKTGDNTRRYLGSFYSNASNGIAPFYHELQSGFMQINDMTRERVRVLNNGVATSSTNVSFSALVPPSSQRASCRVLSSASTASGVIALVGNPDYGAVSTSTSGPYINSFFTQQDTYHVLSLSTTQQINYTYTASPSGAGLYLDLQGYYYNR